MEEELLELILEINGRCTGSLRPGITMPPRRENNPSREIIAALAELNLLNSALRTNTNDRTMEAMRAFRRMKPPEFDGESSDPLVADHWLAQVRKIFNALRIMEDDLRVSIVAIQLTGKTNEWWELVLGARKDARRVAMAINRTNDPDVENLTWAKFEELFGNQYFPETCREQLREQFKKLEQGNMTTSDYAVKFQSLSRFAPELVATEERKCRHFEKGLHSSVKLLVVSQRIGKFSQIVECARSVEISIGTQGDVEVWKPKQPTASASLPSGSSWSQGRKRQREPPQSLQVQQSFGPPTSSGSHGVSVEPQIVCRRCGQPVTFVLSVHNNERHVSFAVHLIILQEDALRK
ncbi:uncharacterized protein LOC131317324 [Rhododendron vialii]|uniref:uncharacterized protein LOC131317324 n=1 Tax=Rhododendron vialii TaxID=182163 RepID=UPI0026603D12|nr:uncharacterized protein LOC131317324 [Rhododendron vialii]